MNELLILVPGLGGSARSQQKEIFIQGMVHASEHIVLNRVEGENIPPGMVRLSGKHDDESYEWDVTEAYWNDQVTSLTKETIKTKVLRGLSLFSYWTFSGIWKGIRNRKYLTTSIIISTVILLFWYVGILFLFAKSLSSSTWLDPEIAKALEEYGSWEIWATATAVMGVIPVARIIDIMDFSKKYISEESDNPETPALRLKIVKQVRDHILTAIQSADYDRVTIVSHSFGTVIAVDVLADLPVSEKSELRLISLGSPLELLARRAPWLNREKEKCIERPELKEWIDVNSQVDWLSTGVNLPNNPKAVTLKVRPTGTVIDRVVGNVHSRYFDNQDVVSCIISVPQ